MTSYLSSFLTSSKKISPGTASVTKAFLLQWREQSGGGFTDINLDKYWKETKKKEGRFLKQQRKLEGNDLSKENTKIEVATGSRRKWREGGAGKSNWLLKRRRGAQAMAQSDKTLGSPSRQRG